MQTTTTNMQDDHKDRRTITKRQNDDRDTHQLQKAMEWPQRTIKQLQTHKILWKHNMLGGEKDANWLQRDTKTTAGFSS